MGDVEYSNYLRSVIKNAAARFTREIKWRIAVTKAKFNKKKALFTNNLGLNLRNKMAKCYIWSTALCCVETWTLRKVDQKYLDSFEMWC
jgi:hypothetical protein